MDGLVLQMLRGRIITPHGTLHDNIFLIRVIVKYFFEKYLVVSRIDTRGVCVAGGSVWPEESLGGSHEGLQQVVDEPELGVGGGGAQAEGH